MMEITPELDRLATAVAAIERDLGLRNGFLLELPKGDDWSFVIKTHALLSANRQAPADRIPYVSQGLFLGRSLAHAAGYGRAFDDPGPILVTIDGHGKLHG